MADRFLGGGKSPYVSWNAHGRVVTQSGSIAKLKNMGFVLRLGFFWT